MKKIKITIIAFLLFGIHIIFFIKLFEQKKEYLTNKDLSEASYEKEYYQTMEYINNIYVPSNKKGFMRNDRNDIPTKKVYQDLIADPYRGAIVIDANTGRILFQDHAVADAYPASVTKLMTLLLTLEAIDRGDINKTDLIKINDEISSIGASQLHLDPRETDFTVEDMLYGIMVHSANDAARALSIHIAGSKKEFVKMMNMKAKKLGMNSTYYHSDHGLVTDINLQADISTAYDIGLLTLACLRHPETITYTGRELIYLGNRKVMCHTRNHLARKVDGYPGCDGLKTGFINRAGWSIAATAERNGRRVVAVVLGSKDRKIRDSMATDLLDFGFKEIEK